MKKKHTTERYTLADLENWRKAARDVDPPIRLGVFGDPVAHSLSPQMQNAALKRCEIGMQYARFHIRANELRSALRFLCELDFIGVNLTVPHKIAGFAQIDEADERANRTGAVNTIRLRDKKLIGSNTDGEGFLRVIRSEFSVDVLVTTKQLELNPNDPPPIPTQLIAPHHTVFDAIYGPSRPSFLRAADQAGARGVIGLSMLLHQGALSFSIWFDREAPIDAMRAALPR